MDALDWSGMDPRRRVNRDDYSAADMPEYPARPFIAHLWAKCFEAGGTIGLVATPVLALTRKLPLGTAWRRAMPGGFLFATAVTWGMTAKKLHAGSLDVAGVDDRGYRLSKNGAQLHVDRYALVGGLAGAAAGGVLGRFALRSVVAAGLTGAALGVFAHAGETIVLPKLQARSGGGGAAAAAAVADAVAEGVKPVADAAAGDGKAK
jgi:hypothetical protein